MLPRKILYAMTQIKEIVRACKSFATGPFDMHATNFFCTPQADFNIVKSATMEMFPTLDQFNWTGVSD